MTENVPSPEYRRCPVTGRWVIIAPERSLRPITLRHATPHHRDRMTEGICPFCIGGEDQTPNEVYAVRDATGWKLRVVPNKFPAVRPKSDLLPYESESDGYFEKSIAFGLHEVVIDCPQHETNPANLTDEQFTLILEAYQQRVSAHAENRQFVYSTVFKNVGAEAGASLAHSHSQIVAMPQVPDAIRNELEVANEYYLQSKRCVYCELIERERKLNERVVAECGRFLAVCPYAPRFAYEVWILPTFHESQYEVTSHEDLGDLAALMRHILKRLDAILDHPAYNYYLHTGPLRSNHLNYYHWHWEIIPQTTRAAGFEWGSGCFINAALPERAAKILRG